MFVPNTPNVRNNYSAAIKNAVEAFKSNADLDYYIVSGDDFKRPEGSAPYAVTSACNALNKFLAAMKSPYVAIVGKDDGEACVAIAPREQ